MYATVAAAAALHQVLLRSLGEDKVVAQNVASGLFCALFLALGVRRGAAARTRTTAGPSGTGSTSSFARRRRSSSNWIRSRAAVRPHSCSVNHASVISPLNTSKNRLTRRPCSVPAQRFIEGVDGAIRQ